MSSLGENNINISSYIVGRIRALQIYPDQSLFPRLVISAGITLFEQSIKSLINQYPGISTMQMQGIFGELRLKENGEIIGSVVWNGPHRIINASFAGNEDQIALTCDLDFWILEQIERRRNGAAPEFWLQLWPTLLGDGKVIDCNANIIKMNIPREQWLNFYTKVGGTQYEILEIQYPQKAFEQFQRAISRTREARSKIFDGENDEAVALCRNVIEALNKELRPSETEEDPLKALFLLRTDERRAKEYSRIVSCIKQLTSIAHHEIGNPLMYSRDEATFIIRLTESILSLVGHLSDNS